MANEITEIGQIVTYGGQPLTLLGSDIASKVNSILIRQGSGTARAWKLFDPTKSDFLNTYKVLNPGDTVLVNAKAVPMDFPVASGSTGGGADSISLSGPAGETTTEFEEVFTASAAATPSVAFSSGAGTVEYSTNSGSTWGALPATIPASTSFAIRVLHPNSAAFSASLTLTY